MWRHAVRLLPTQLWWDQNQKNLKCLSEIMECIPNSSPPRTNYNSFKTNTSTSTWMHGPMSVYPSTHHPKWVATFPVLKFCQKNLFLIIQKQFRNIGNKFSFISYRWEDQWMKQMFICPKGAVWGGKDSDWPTLRRTATRAWEFFAERKTTFPGLHSGTIPLFAIDLFFSYGERV